MIDFKKLLGRAFICPYCGFPQGKIGLSKKGFPFYTCYVCHTKTFLNAEISIRGFVKLLEWAKESQRDLMMGHAKDTKEILDSPAVGQVETLIIPQKEGVKQDV